MSLPIVQVLPESPWLQGDLTRPVETKKKKRQIRKKKWVSIIYDIK